MGQPFVCSDNGGPERSGFGGNNFPLKGGKWTEWQGGVCVNSFTSSGYLPKSMQGQKTDGYIHIADWYAVFSLLAPKPIFHQLIASMYGRSYQERTQLHHV